MDFQQMMERAMQVREQYAKREQEQYSRTWSREEIALGFVGDVGDLMKLVQAKEGVRGIPNADAKIAHEFADCLWSILVLSKLYEVDLERVFIQTMNEIEQHLQI